MSARSDAYRFLSTVYDPLTNPFLDPIRRTLCRLIARSRPARVLDVCCGTGRLCRLLQPNCPSIAGLDLSMGMLRVARRKSPASIGYLLADAATPSLRDRSFDALILSLALHEKTPEAGATVLHAGYRLLTPGGLLYILELNAPEPSLKSRLAHAVIKGVERAAGKEHFACFTSFLNHGGIEGLLGRVPELTIMERRSFRSGNLKLVVCRAGG